MKRILTRLALFVSMIVGIAAGPAVAAPSSPQAAVDELLAADRKFSHDGHGIDVVDAIAAMLDQDVRAPIPPGAWARGKAEYVAALRASPLNANATADWAPVRGGISADGTQGFTFGFMNIHYPDKPDVRAKYLAYWIKRGEGWRVIAYKRAGSAPGPVATALRPASLPSHMLPVRPSDALSDKYRNELKARESAFSDRAQQVGLSQAFLEYGAPDAMNNSPGPDFAYGPDAISANQPTDVPPGVFWAADERTLVSSTGDLGINYGTIRLTDSLTTIPFFTIWRRAKQNGQWLYIAEL